MQFPLAESTVNAIHGQLGDTEDLEIGFEKTGSVQGQIVKPIAGGFLHEPHIIDYKARVVAKGRELDWKIVEWKIVV